MDKLSVRPDAESQGTAWVEHDQVPVDAALTSVDESAEHQPEITAAERKFIADRSVTLLVKLTKGELTPAAALRQAETMPVRKGKIKRAGPGQDGEGSAS